MISVVFSTRTHNQSHIEHIKRTSGLSKNIEILQFINNGEYSLTEIYNKGLKESKYDIVIFCHDDIIFNKDNWGKKILSHFEKDIQLGILGIAGTTDMPVSGKWWEDSTKMVGIVKHSNNGRTWESKYSANFEGDVIETVVNDGLFFACHKNRIKVNFDESFKGFHFYDIDFTFNNHIHGVKVGVVFDIKITHMSIGMTNEQWEANRVQFVNKFSKNLPIKINPEIKVDYKEIVLKEKPKLGIIIPTKGNVDLLKQCINSIYDNDGYTMFKIYVADTGSNKEELNEIKNFINKIGDSIKLIEYDYYNFASINNDVVINHIDNDTELLLFCNNDIKLVNNAISKMVDVYNKNKKTIGTIGARLHYEDNTIQHSGIIAMLRQVDKQYIPMVTHYGLRSYFNYYKENHTVLGNTGAFLMINKELFSKVGYFDESFVECFEDVKLNIDCLRLNKKNIFCGDAVCYHLESQTRNKSEDKINNERLDLNKIIPYLIRNEVTYDYFINIKRKDLENLIKNGSTSN